MQAVAFYLPQFHVIPENEQIYGKGFTEWDNVRNARPLFSGHYQPHVPHKTLGYYDLTDEKFLVFQHELAYGMGVQAFCYYYYNFVGRRVLEKPLDIINNNKSIKNNFCLCWDPGSWRNNRKNKDVFIESVFSVEAAKLIFKDLLRYFENPRHICIDGKPMFNIFAPERNPMMAQYADIWREEAHKHGLPGIWLGGVAAYLGFDPSWVGLDGAIEFAPAWNEEALISAPGENPRRYDYSVSLRCLLSRELPDYTKLRCAFPAWDNTPRRGRNGISTVGVNVELYKTHLDCLAEYTKHYLPPQLQYIFINAWNEWGEGAHLEPDERDGYDYLLATKEVMQKYGMLSN